MDLFNGLNVSEDGAAASSAPPGKGGVPETPVPAPAAAPSSFSFLGGGPPPGGGPGWGGGPLFPQPSSPAASTVHSLDGRAPFDDAAAPLGEVEIDPSLLQPTVRKKTRRANAPGFAARGDGTGSAGLAGGSSSRGSGWWDGSAGPADSTVGGLSGGHQGQYTAGGGAPPHANGGAPHPMMHLHAAAGDVGKPDDSEGTVAGSSSSKGAPSHDPPEGRALQTSGVVGRPLGPGGTGSSSSVGSAAAAPTSSVGGSAAAAPTSSVGGSARPSVFGSMFSFLSGGSKETTHPAALGATASQPVSSDTERSSQRPPPPPPPPPAQQQPVQQPQPSAFGFLGKAGAPAPPPAPGAPGHYTSGSGAGPSLGFEPTAPKPAQPSALRPGIIAKSRKTGVPASAPAQPSAQPSAELPAGEKPQQEVPPAITPADQINSAFNSASLQATLEKVTATSDADIEGVLHALKMHQQTLTLARSEVQEIEKEVEEIEKQQLVMAEAEDWAGAEALGERVAELKLRRKEVELRGDNRRAEWRKEQE